MNLARNIERRLERLVDGLAGRLFPGRVQASELANRVIREADLALVEGPAGPTAPNVFGIRISAGDLGTDQAPEALCAELAAAVEQTAAQQGWRLEGQVVVEIVTDTALSPGSLEVAASRAVASLGSWALLEGRHGDQRYEIRHNRCLVGRSDEADIRLGQPEISRRHALIWREGSASWIADLGSANGTWINGRAVQTVEALEFGDALTFGPASFTFLPA